MIREFLRSVNEILRNLRAGKQFFKYRPAEPLAANEKEIGTITDSWLKAIYIAFRIRCAAAEELMNAPGAQMDPDQRIRLANEISSLTAMVFGDLRSVFGNNVIGVRRNWVVAAMAADAKPKSKRQRKPSPPMIVRPKDYLPGNLASCGNPDCTTCPGHKIPLPPRPPGDHVIM